VARRILQEPGGVELREAVTAAWKHYVYEPVDLPFVPVREWPAFLRDRL
jgi:hypothetical protein